MQIKVTTGALERHGNTNPQIGNGSAGDGHGPPLSPYRFLLEKIGLVPEFLIPDWIRSSVGSWDSLNQIDR